MGVRADVGQDGESIGVVQEDSAYNLSQYVVRDPRDSGVIEHNALHLRSVAYLLVGEPANHRVLAYAGCCLHHLQPRQKSPGLILPATAGC